MKTTFKKSETFYFKKEVPCIVDYGFGGKEARVLFPRISYSLTSLKLINNEFYSFELWDDQGYIGTYYVNKKQFEDNAVPKDKVEEVYKSNEVDQAKDVTYAYLRTLNRLRYRRA